MFRAGSTGAYVRAGLVWLAALVVFWLLYQSAGGATDARAIVEAREHRIASTEPGKLAELMVQPGQRVKRGEVLVRLDADELEGQIRVLRAELERLGSATEAAAVTLASGAFGDERSLAGELQAARGAEAAERATLARDQAELEVVRTALRDEQAAVARGLARNDRALELAARERVLGAQSRSGAERLAAAAARTGQAQARLEQWRRQFGPAAAGQPQATQLQPLRAAVQEKEAALQALLERRQRLAIVSPDDGVVTSIGARVGDVARPGEPLLVVTEAVPHQVVAYLVERQRLRVQPGQRVSIHRQGGAAGATDTVTGEVRSVGQAVTALPARLVAGSQAAAGWGREVYISLPANAGLQPGELVGVRFLDPHAGVFNRSVADVAASVLGR